MENPIFEWMIWGGKSTYFRKSIHKNPMGKLQVEPKKSLNLSQLGVRSNPTMSPSSYRGYEMDLADSQKKYTSWWFQPIWKILVNLDHFPK